jgi:1-aminocyclopropane-1-carboxylate deaminase/D-cysteine desulfhydrase-like pyridoxal-dependent ACC family enzyme
MLLSLPSLIQFISFQDHHFYLKRDDLIHPDFSGNKARKFYYFLTHKFPYVEKIISHGSVQSNAMYSLSVLAKMRGWKFEYHVNHIPDYLRENPHGNYKAALENGTRFQVGSAQVAGSSEENILFIEEGGRQPEAEYGIRILAEEIIAWQKENSIKELNVFLPSGTGTTALFLQKNTTLLTPYPKGTCPSGRAHSALLTKVYTCPCVGDSTYLKKQFSQLEPDETYHPHILTLEKKHHFGKLYRENYEIWLKLQQETGVVFDLLYDPLGWRTLLAHPEVCNRPTLYLHQGGVLGNESMLRRYLRKYPQISSE